MENTATLVRRAVDLEHGNLLVDMPYDIAKASNLARIGFKQSELVRDVRDHKQHHSDARYYQQKYPQYKFITEHQLEKIAGQYGLQTRELSAFLGAVPDKNLNDILNFKVFESDLPEPSIFGRSLIQLSAGGRGSGGSVRSLMDEYRTYYESVMMGSFGLPDVDARIGQVGERVSSDDGPNFMAEVHPNKSTWPQKKPHESGGVFDAFEQRAEKMRRQHEERKPRMLSFSEVMNERAGSCSITAESKLFVAPVPDLDPIVTVQVKGGYLIVTAWGEEASDPDVINPVNN